MKAVIIENYGGKEEMKMVEFPMPKAAANQVVIKEEATSINPVDWKTREGYLQEVVPLEFPIILGSDVAGTIIEVGSDVMDWKVGDRVFAQTAMTSFGTYGEYVPVEDNLIAKIPSNVSFSEAAAIPLAALMAWQGLFDYGHLKKGETVLILGGAGGIGTYAIQFAKEIGAKVLTTASKKNHELVTSLGADQVIDYRSEKVSDLLEDVDLVFDTIGGAAQKEAFSVLKPKTGRMITIVGLAEEGLAEKQDVYFESIFLKQNAAQLTEVVKLIEAGKVKSVIGATFPFSEKGLQDAHELSATGHAIGKIIVEF